MLIIYVNNHRPLLPCCCFLFWFVASLVHRLGLLQLLFIRSVEGFLCFCSWCVYDFCLVFFVEGAQTKPYNVPMAVYLHAHKVLSSFSFLFLFFAFLSCFSFH